MKFNKLTFQGPQTSMSIAGKHFRKDVPTYLLDSELPFSLAELKGLRIRCDVVETQDDTRPASAGSTSVGSVGMVWQGMSPKKITDWGTFVRGVPRFDIPAEAVVRLSGRSSWEKVSR